MPNFKERSEHKNSDSVKLKQRLRMEQAVLRVYGEHNQSIQQNTYEDELSKFFNPGEFNADSIEAIQNVKLDEIIQHFQSFKDALETVPGNYAKNMMRDLLERFSTFKNNFQWAVEMADTLEAGQKFHAEKIQGLANETLIEKLRALPKNTNTPQAKNSSNERDAMVISAAKLVSRHVITDRDNTMDPTAGSFAIVKLMQNNEEFYYAVESQELRLDQNQSISVPENRFAGFTIQIPFTSALDVRCQLQNNHEASVFVSKEFIKTKQWTIGRKELVELLDKQFLHLKNITAPNVSSRHVEIYSDRNNNKNIIVYNKGTNDFLMHVKLAY